MFQSFKDANLRQLIFFKAYADLRAEAERTYIGYLWWILEPVVHMGVYYVVIGLFLDRGTDDFVPFLLTGLTAWRWFNMGLFSAMPSILRSKGLMNQVAVDKSLFPTVAILTQTFKFVIVYAVLLIFLWIYGYPVTASYWHLAGLLVIQLVFISACGYLLAAITPFLPDIVILMQNAMRALFFFSGIFYAGRELAPQLQFYFYMNPMAVIIDAHRDILLYAQTPDWTRLAIIGFCSVPILLFAEMVIARNQDIYPKVVH